jgi:hypothetical protein
MSLFSLKKRSLSLSLSLFLFKSSFSFFLRYIMFWLSIRFFFSSLFVHFFSYWVRSSVGLLSLFFPFKGRSETTSSVCLSLSLSYEERVLENPISLSNTPRHTKRERDDHLCEERRDIDASDTNSRAKAGKKKMDWISSHCGTRTAATKSSRVKDENA